MTEKKIGNKGDESSIPLQEKKDDEPWPDYYTRTCRIARKIRVKMNVPFPPEVIAESMWHGMGL